MNGKALTLVALLIVAVVSVGAYTVGYHRAGTDVLHAPECTPSATEQCPSDQFYSDFRQWEALKREVIKDQAADPARALQAKADQLQGMTTRLASQVPQGFTWDDKRLRFVKLPPPPEPFKPAVSPAAPVK